MCSKPFRRASLFSRKVLFKGRQASGEMFRGRRTGSLYPKQHQQEAVCKKGLNLAKGGDLVDELGGHMVESTAVIVRDGDKWARNNPCVQSEMVLTLCPIPGDI